MTKRELTNKEIKEELLDMKRDVVADSWRDKALDVAIKAVERVHTMSEEEFEAYLKDEDLVVVKRKILKKAIKALEQQPCEDAISRAEALRIAKSYYHAEYVVDKIRQLPSVTPQQKIGKWIDEGFYAEGHNEHAYRCSECDEHYIGYVGEFKYCPNCGAKMEVEE